jgi:21S rRNA (GM2251-2'-O)-methyltransferase
LVKILGNVDGLIGGADEDIDAGEEGGSFSSNPGLKSFFAVESLNVSVAAGVVLLLQRIFRSFWQT